MLLFKGRLNDVPAKRAVMDVLGIFVKRPVAGRVKTRLAEEVGAERAAELYAAFVGDLADRFRQCADWRFLCFAPPDEAARSYFNAVAGGDYELWPQPQKTLGERMGKLFEHAFGNGARRVVVIGSDSPTLPLQCVTQAFCALRDHDCVLGPATDGGYYLIGQRAPGAALFDDISWSSSRVLEQTASRIQPLGLSLHLLPPWYDVDTVQDLALLRGHLRALRAAGVELDLTRVTALLE